MKTEGTNSTMMGHMKQSTLLPSPSPLTPKKRLKTSDLKFQPSLPFGSVIINTNINSNININIAFFFETIFS